MRVKKLFSEASKVLNEGAWEHLLSTAPNSNEADYASVSCQGIPFQYDVQVLRLSSRKGSTNHYHKAIYLYMPEMGDVAAEDIAAIQDALSVTPWEFAAHRLDAGEPFGVLTLRGERRGDFDTIKGAVA